MEEGLTPIRIQFKHIDFNGDFDLYSELHNAVKTATASLKSSIEPKKDDFSCLSSENVFLNGKIFEDTTTYKNNKLCPYVLILDGWDELSLAQSQTFKDRIDKVLATVKKNLITSNDKSKVKIIVTGRSTEDVTKDSNFITPNTKILTIKPLNPKSLNDLFDNIVKHSQYPDPAKIKEEIKSIIEAYTEYFNSRTEQELINKHYEAIGTPLLAALVLKLALNEDYQLKELFNNPTDLYRSLADLTVEYGGRDEKAFDKIKNNIIYAASNQKMDLRSLLREIAIAISILGKESISSYELETRLLHPENNISTQVEDIIKEDSISRLYALFYFKAGHKSYGCEFIHKSFREYFFAEALIVKLIQAGSDLKINNNEETKIKHFEKISCILAPRWLTPEINNHVKNLIEYHINRSDEEKLEIWEITRDWLADYFVWWADKEHMTPQMYLDRRGEAQTEPPFVEELAQETRPYDYEKNKLPKITDYISLDSHLGDSVFQLNCYVHAYIAEKQLSLANIELSKWSWENSNQCHKHQWNVKIEGQNFTVFGFIGSETFKKNENDYLLNYFARINSTPGRPQGMAPLSYFMHLINLSGVDLSYARLDDVSLNYASLNYARLDFARLDYASLDHARLDNVSLDYVFYLTLKQIESAYIYDSTKLPIYIWEQMGADENERQEYFEKLIKNSPPPQDFLDIDDFDDI